MRVTNLTSPRTGAKVANQYNIEHNGVDYFQSYDTMIARYKPNYLEVTEDYNYSNTTSKYFKQWLGQWGITPNEVDRLKKLLSNSVPNGGDFDWLLDNGNRIVVYYTSDGFSL